MSGIYNHRQMGPALGGRIPELLESLKAEYDTLTQDVGVFNRQKDDVESKVSQQLQEMVQLQKMLHELEGRHGQIKQQYEEEINHLKRELETRATTGNTGNAGNTQQQHAQAQAQGLPLGLGATPSFAQGLASLDGGPNKRLKTDTSSGVSLPQLGSQLPQLTAQLSQGQIPASDADKPKVPFSMNDLDIESLPASQKKDGADWVVAFNKNVQQIFDIDLAHSIDHNSVVCCLKFSADSKFLATGCNRITQIFDVQTGQRVAEFSDGLQKDDDLYIRYVCFSPDGQYLATGAEDKLIRIWDIKNKKIRLVLSGHTQDIYAVDFSRDGKIICSGSGDKTVRVWNAETGECLFILNTEESGGRESGVTALAITPDGKFIAAASLDRVIRLWELKTGGFLAKLEGHTDSVYAVSFSPDGRYLASGSLDKTTKLWEIETSAPVRGRLVLTCAGHKDFVLSVGFSPDGKWIISGSKDRTVQFWDPATGSPICMLQGHKNSVISVGVAPNALAFATGSGDCKARIWRCNPISAGGLPAFPAAITAVPQNPLASLAGIAAEAKTEKEEAKPDGQ